MATMKHAIMHCQCLESGSSWCSPIVMIVAQFNLGRCWSQGFYHHVVTDWDPTLKTGEDSLEYRGDGFMPPQNMPWSEPANYLWSRLISGERQLVDYAGTVTL